MIRKYVLVSMFSFYSMLIQNTAYYLQDLETTPGNSNTYPSVPQIIRENGYPAETHIVRTKDGYLLECHRIPHGKYRNSSTNNPYPVLLVHGFPFSSECWINNGPNESLAYLLADDGYDVWMLNLRGNTYSRRHVSLTPMEGEFWDFSSDEIGMYDVPATIDFILNITNTEKLVYVGQSLGTTIFFVFASTFPTYANKVLFQISLGAFAGIPHSTSAYRLAVPLQRLLQSMPPKRPILEHSFTNTFFLKLVCDGNALTNEIICARLIIAALFGDDPAQFNQKLLSVYTSYIPAGGSFKTVLQIIQFLDPGDFTKYDYGPAGNIKKYGTATPPAYDVNSISIPVRFYQGKNDLVADPIDSQILYGKLQKPMGLIFISFDKWNHIDFLFAIDLRKYLNEQLLQFIRNVTVNPESIDTIVQSARHERSQTTVPANELFDKTNFINSYNNRAKSNPILSKALKML